MSDIFQWIERKMGAAIPVYIKNVLKCCGYDNCHSIATIVDDDIEYFADQVKKGNIHNDEAVMENVLFNRGHRKFLQAIVKTVKDVLETHGVDEFITTQPKNLPQLKENNASKGVSVYRKRFKFSTETPDLTSEASKYIIVSPLRSILIKKIVLDLITQTPKLFVNNFERMMINKDPIRLEILAEDGISYISCPYCKSPITVAQSQVESSNNSWWNSSNFNRHLQLKHPEAENVSTNQATNHALTVTAEASVQSRVHSLSNSENDKSLGIVLQTLVDSAERNKDRKKAGYRFDSLTKMFASYIFMLSGPLAYETLNANMSLSMPSISTVHRFISDKGPRIIEGEMRTKELLKYLKDRNLPFKVALSEDATRITAKVSYDPITNQLVGFALPLSDNGMPIKFSFPARNVNEIQNHFKNSVSSLAYIQMAQPLADNCTPFCLMLYLIDNTFTTKNVTKRWRHQASELKETGISIYNIATDGDSRPLLAMKILSKIGHSDKSYFDCEWFSCGGYVETTFTQDMTHILTKLRNRLLTSSRIFPIGNKIVSLTHLKYLIENVSKDKHLLTMSDINPKDRQNYPSADKMCSGVAMKSLIEFVPGCEATVMYLQAMRNLIMAYLDVYSLSSTELIYRVWCAVFFFRAWRSWLLNSEKVPTKSKKSKKFYTLKDNFISANCYTCIELNAHALVKKLLTEDGKQESNGGIAEDEIFFPDLYGSQPCESTFRQTRSFTSTYSTIVNFNMLDIIHRIDKIQLQSDIINQSHGLIKFPRFEKKIITSGNKLVQKLTRSTIKSEIKRARQCVIDDMEKMGIVAAELNFNCQVKPAYEQNIEDVDSDFDSDCDDLEFLIGRMEESEPDDSLNIEECTELEKAYLSGIAGDVLLRDYSQVENVKGNDDSLEIDEKSPFVMLVDDKGNRKIVRKSSICWLLSKGKHKLSSDRLVRVTEREYSSDTPDMNSRRSLNLTADGIVQEDQLAIGEWAIFSVPQSDKSNSKLIGLVLGFSYLDGKTFKDREFSKEWAPTVSEKGNVGVLCSFYSYNEKGILLAVSDEKHKFTNMNAYFGTISKPVYKEECLYVPEKLIFSLR